MSIYYSATGQVTLDTSNAPHDPFTPTSNEDLIKAIRLLKYSTVNVDINSWNVSNITNMEGLFQKTNFNQPLNNWDVSHVTNMSAMFSECPNFNQPLDQWNVSQVTDMSSMFSECPNFNQPLEIGRAHV